MEVDIYIQKSLWCLRFYQAIFLFFNSQLITFCKSSIKQFSTRLKDDLLKMQAIQDQSIWKYMKDHVFPTAKMTIMVYD